MGRYNELRAFVTQSRSCDIKLLVAGNVGMSLGLHMNI